MTQTGDVRRAAGSYLIGLIATSAIAVLCAACPAEAQDAIARFYAGKQINLVIGSSVGGGYDTYARILARYMSKYIPGNPKIVPQNMPGGGSNKAAGYVYSVAPKDGTTFGAIFPGAVVEPILGEKGQVMHDPSKLLYLGSASNDVFMCGVRSDVPVKTFQDVFSREVILGASAEGGSTRNLPVMLDNLLGTKFRLVSGYPGTREITFAIERGEVEGACGLSWSSTSVQHPDWVSKGFFRILAQEHATGHPVMNKMGIPLTIQFAKSPEDRQIMELIYSQQVFGRPYILPPGVPPERVGALRRAFMDAMQDKVLLAEVEKLQIDLSPISGEELQALISRIYSTPADVLERAKDALIYKPPK